MYGNLNRVIAALDFPSMHEALDFVKRSGDELLWCKVGMELFTREGYPVIEGLKREKKMVFLDLKFHDIPNTVEGAVKSAVACGVDMLTVHASGGSEMLRAAASAAKVSGTKVVAVTVLTSLNESDLRVFGTTGPVSSMVERLTEMALHSGVDGVVCSPLEVAHLKGKFGEDFIAVTPGIRLPDDEKGDQKRVAAPEDAFEAGADFIVVGRSLTAVADPRKRLREIALRIGQSKT